MSRKFLHTLPILLGHTTWLGNPPLRVSATENCRAPMLSLRRAHSSVLAAQGSRTL